ncbi:hypothetical protein [uncultured Mucilaginibacter sp.]|uniref:hypothetical protein n=1 Tax=uncultured Mucilaginibacter sp. TaxID=797541 RepID=UPI0025D577CF|nr:hypothetical protein [uncultured Mucilaginibacter sp.]
MNTPKPLMCIPLITLLVAGILNTVNAQHISCENLLAIVKAIAGDSTMRTIKAEIAKEAMGDDSAQYFTSIPIWDYLDDLHGEYIEYDKALGAVVYNGYSINRATLTDERERTIKAFENCLGDGWIIRTAIDGLGDTVTYFKHPADYTTLTVKNHEGWMRIKCYHEPKNGSPVCVSGDCYNFYGGVQFFNNDAYTGTFIDGTLSGVGHANWFATQKQYQGSFLDNQLEGYGAIYDENNHAVKKGFFFKGDTVPLDRHKTGCQYGDCENGFGVKLTSSEFFVYADVYIGYFKNGLPEGLGESVTGWGNTETAFFGHYRKGIADGTGIFINYNGNITFGDYINTIAQGNYLTAVTDKTVIQGNYDDHSLTYFDANGILTKSGKQLLAFVENTDPVYLDRKATAKSLSEFYNYRQTGYKEILNVQSKSLKSPVFESYKSKRLFQGRFDTNVCSDQHHDLYIIVSLSGKSVDKPAWVKLYNKYYKMLDKALGNQWRVTTDKGIAGVEKISSSIVFRNIFDLSKSIELLIDKRGVQLEIH